MEFKLFIAGLIFLMAGGLAFAEENESVWETSIKMQVRALKMPWEGPFVSTVSNESDERRVTESIDDWAGEWFTGGGVEIESFYKKHLFGRSLPIEFGFRGYYNSFDNDVSTVPVAEPKILSRRGWSHIDGVSSSSDSRMFTPLLRPNGSRTKPNEITFSNVSRKIKDFGVDLIRRREISMQSGKLQLMAGPSFFRMTQRTEMFSYVHQRRVESYLRQSSNPDYINRDVSEIIERIDANYYGIKVGVDLALPVSEDFTFIVGANVGGYVLDANYEGEQHMDLSFMPAATNRTAQDHDAVFSYTSEVEAGLEYDTGFGTIGVSGEARYLSKVPLVNYISMGTNIAQNYEPAHLGFDSSYSFGGNIRMKFGRGS